VESWKALPVISDSKEMAEEIEETLAAVIKAGRQWLQLLQAGKGGFYPLNIVKAKSKVNIADISGLAYTGSVQQSSRNLQSQHPMLEERLRKWRNEVIGSSGQPVYTVCSNKSLTDIATHLPQTENELLQMQGFGPAKTSRYGQAILALVHEYCEQNQLTSEGVAITKKTKKKPANPSEKKSAKADTKQVSYALWQQKKTIEEIAAIRQLNPSTIFGHLAHFALQGEIPIDMLIPKALFDECCAIIADLKTTSVIPVKEILGERATYAQIRLAMDWMKHQAKQ
jgi:ribonuclease D